jgi:hypothetical protein
MEVVGRKYSVRFDAQTATIFCTGILDVRGKEGYQPIVDLFNAVIDLQPELITLDVRQLEFLNSSGITAIGSGLVIKVRNKGCSRLAICCSDQYPWQKRSMKGISKLMPGIELRFE